MAPNSYRVADAFTTPAYSSAYEEVEAFNRRKEEDMKRLDTGHGVRRRKRFHDRFEQASDEESGSPGESDSADDAGSDAGEEAWKNSEGERLRDFGVDEEIEFYDEEDIPLGILMQQNRRH